MDFPLSVAADSGYRQLYSAAAVMPRKSPSGDETDAVIKGKKKLACTSCRQAKLRCVGLRQGSSCLRCQRKSIACQIDPQFKRTTQQTKLRQLSHEVQQLKGLLATNSTAGHEACQSKQIDQFSPQRHGLTAVQSADSPQSSSTRHAGTKSSINQDMAQDKFIQTETSRVFGSIAIDGSQISKLFQVYYQYFHPQLPIINTNISIDRYFDQAPLLFWTILAIASRSGQTQSDLHLELCEPLTQLLWAKVAVVPLSHFTIQAILLLCTWPYSPVSLMSDPTSMLVSMAKTGCEQLGLHRPEHMQDYHRVRFKLQRQHIREAVMLWTCCFITAERVGSGEGHDSIFSTEDPVLVHASGLRNVYQMPTSLHQRLRCYMQVHQLRLTVAQSAHRVPDSPQILLSPLIKMTGMALETLKSEMKADYQDSIMIEFLCAKLQTYILYLHEPPTSSNHQQGVVQAFQAAMELITKMQTSCSQSTFCYSAPRYFGQNLKLAAFLLSKVRFSTASRIFDVDEIEKSYALATSLHQQMSIHENDFHDRAAILLSDLWTMRSKDSKTQLQHPTVTLTSRGSASLLYESHWQWRGYHASRTHAAKSLNRPPGTLPSIVLHSPMSEPQDDNAPYTRSNSEPQTNYQDDHTTETYGQPFPSTDQQNIDVSGQENDLDLFEPDLQLDPLELMYAYLDPDEEASQLFGTPWTAWDKSLSSS